MSINRAWPGALAYCLGGRRLRLCSYFHGFKTWCIIYYCRCNIFHTSGSFKVKIHFVLYVRTVIGKLYSELWYVIVHLSCMPDDNHTDWNIIKYLYWGYYYGHLSTLYYKGKRRCSVAILVGWGYTKQRFAMRLKERNKVNLVWLH
jgi:hypothetical protein